MKDFLLSLQGVILLGGVFGLLAIVAGVFASETIRSWKIWRSKKNWAAMTMVAVVALHVGGTKQPKLYITWDTGLHDNGSEINTKDLRQIHIKWTYDSWIPAAATFSLRAVPISAANQDPSVYRTFEVASVPITNLQLYAIMELAATNYLFFAEHSFIPDQPVVTNVVYHLRCVGGENVWVPIGAKIYDGAECIAPPDNSVYHLIYQPDVEDMLEFYNSIEQEEGDNAP